MVPRDFAALLWIGPIGAMGMSGGIWFMIVLTYLDHQAHERCRNGRGHSCCRARPLAAFVGDERWSPGETG
ncbi:MAG: hypothetical protein IPK53_08645 [bacterium]|nr:hypothetical protein [bacterium]